MVANRLFAIGIVLVLLGVQFRRVDTIVLNEKTTRFVAKRLEKLKPASAAAGYTMDAALFADSITGDLPLPGKTAMRSIKPPPWLGLSLISMGAVLVLTYPCFKD